MRLQVHAAESWVVASELVLDMCVWRFMAVPGSRQPLNPELTHPEINSNFDGRWTTICRKRSVPTQAHVRWLSDPKFVNFKGCAAPADRRGFYGAGINYGIGLSRFFEQDFLLSRLRPLLGDSFALLFMRLTPMVLKQGLF